MQNCNNSILQELRSTLLHLEPMSMDDYLFQVLSIQIHQDSQHMKMNAMQQFFQQQSNPQQTITNIQETEEIHIIQEPRIFSKYKLVTFKGKKESTLN